MIAGDASLQIDRPSERMPIAVIIVLFWHGLNVPDVAVYQVSLFAAHHLPQGVPGTERLAVATCRKRAFADGREIYVSQPHARTD